MSKKQSLDETPQQHQLDAYGGVEVGTSQSNYACRTIRFALVEQINPSQSTTGPYNPRPNVPAEYR